MQNDLIPSSIARLAAFTSNCNTIEHTDMNKGEQNTNNYNATTVFQVNQMTRNIAKMQTQWRIT